MFKKTASLLLMVIALHAQGQENIIRKNLPERLPNLPAIDEISKTPMPGLFEVRIGSDVFYTDTQANFILQGSLFDVRQRRNLTEERVEKLSAIPFEQLPLKNAFTQVHGNGKRKLVVLADPNCGYCKRFEKDLQNLQDITIYHLLYPILGEDSKAKSRNIWCAKDRIKTWNDWMLRGVTPPAAQCDTAAIDANVEFGKKHRISGTPTLILTDGSRIAGAVPAAQVDKMLNDITP